MIYAQGDVILIKRDALPNGATKKPRAKNEPVVLAYGETTGHSHAIHEGGVIPYEFNEEMWLEITQPAFLRHGKEYGLDMPVPDHTTIELPPGIYERREQFEWRDYARRVVD